MLLALSIQPLYAQDDTMKTISKAVVGMFALYGAYSLLSSIFGSYQNGVSKEESLTLQHVNCGDLIIKNTCGSVSIKVWDNNYIQVDATKKAGTQEDLKKLTIEHVHTSRDISLISEWDSKVIKHASINYCVNVPTSMKNSHVTTKNGSIYIKSLVGNHIVRTSNGSIVIINGTTADVSTSNGKVELRDISGAWKVVSSNGALHIESVAGDGTGISSNGSITVINCNGNNFVQTTNGSIHIINSPNTTGFTTNGEVKKR
jgi:hypothetical protein